MQDNVLDGFEDLSGWTAHTSGEARLHISRDTGIHGPAMRLDFDFHGGGGFVVARRTLPLDLPESYSFSFSVRGDAPRNIFEFKLVDKSNRNVWRYREEEFDFPADWKPMCIRDRQIEFAWGPLGGGPARSTEAVELVIAAGPGGKGTVWIDTLTFRDDTYRQDPDIRASTFLPGHEPRNILSPDESCWRSEPSPESQWLIVDFGREREFGGLLILWEPDFQALEFEVRLSVDGQSWTTEFSTHSGGDDRSYVYLPHALCRAVRLNLLKGIEGRGFGIRAIEIKPFDFSRSLNHFFQYVAAEAEPGSYPKYFLRRQTYWTPVGTGRGDGQALFNEEGMVEVDKGSFSIEPFLFVHGRLVTWADVDTAQELEQGFLPIPSATWIMEDLTLKITAFAAHVDGSPVLFIRYRLESRSPRKQAVRLFAALRPFQVTPVWQSWRAFGGVSKIESLSLEKGVVRVNGVKSVIPLNPPSGFGAAAFARGTVTRYLAAGELPPDGSATDEFGFASGALSFDFDIPPNGAQEAFLAVPFGSRDFPDDVPAALLPESGKGADYFSRAVENAESMVGGVSFQVPFSGRHVADAFKTAAAHILINRDGSALHPGPRRYSRSWIRDGVVMGAALLRIGCMEPLRDFLLWYAGFQAEDGNIPDCADGEGTEWLAEFDAYGEFVYGVMEYYRFTGDSSFLAEMWPASLKALDYMEELRRKRLTEEYRTPEKLACYGLLPESMSHEGYMAHPVHSYWDDFWGVRGYKDGAAMAAVLGHGEEASRLSVLHDSFGKDIRASLAAAIERHKIDFVPGSVEFGDFDPTSTSVAVGLLDQSHLLPPSEVETTFDKYMTGFRERAGGTVAWNNYTAYEIRIIGALVRLGRRKDAAELLEFMLSDRRIRAWNQWPEITWRDPAGPSFLGDLPHTWISAEYMLSVFSMFAYERDADASLVIAAGIPEKWLEEGAVGVENLPTHYGKLSYRLWFEEHDTAAASYHTLRVTIKGDLTLPPGGIVVKPPLPRPIQGVEIDGEPTTEFTSDGFTCRTCPAEATVRF